MSITTRRDFGSAFLSLDGATIYVWFVPDHGMGWVWFGLRPQNGHRESWMGLSEVVKDGDLRQSLEAQRDDLAGRLDVAADRDAAALHRQLSIVLVRIDMLPSGREEGVLDRIATGVADELAARRGAGAAVAGGAAG